VPWLIIGLFLFAQIGASMLQSFVFLAQDRFRSMYAALATHTAYLVQPTLVYNLLVFVVIVLGILIGLGKLRLAELGLFRANLRRGVLVTLAVWGTVQVLALGSAWLGDAPLRWNPAEQGNGVPFLIGALVAQLFGNALIEEICFRGFLLTQFLIKLRARYRLSPAQGVVLAVVFSQLFFALIHVPIRLHQGMSAVSVLASLPETFLFGAFFAALYLRTRNLFVVVGVHALVDEPTSLTMSPIDPVALVLGVALLLLWVGRLDGRT